MPVIVNVRRFFFLFLGLRILRLKFLHFLKKNQNFIFDFFFKKLPDLKKKKNIKKNNKNCMILNCKNAEMTIILSFLHFYSVKSYNFCYLFLKI